MRFLVGLSCIPFLFLTINDAIAAKSDDGEKIDLTVIEARLSDIETAVTGNDTDIASLQTAVAGNDADIGALQSDVGALQFQNVSADCETNSSALQLAIDSAPPSGAAITSTGVCGPVEISGKRNLEIIGQGTTTIQGDGSLDGALIIRNSHNIQLSGITVDANGDALGLVGFASSIIVSNSGFGGAAVYAFGITDTTSASLDAVTIDGSLFGEKSSSYRTEGVTINADLLLTNGASFQGAALSAIGPVSLSSGSSMQIDDGTFSSAIALDGNSILDLVPEADQSVVVNADIRLFRTSTLNARGAGVELNNGLLIVYSGSSASIGDFATVTLFTLVRYNSDLTLFGGSAGEYGNFTPSQIYVLEGSGVRTAGDRGGEIITLDACDATSWTGPNVACP